MISMPRFFKLINKPITGLTLLLIFLMVVSCGSGGGETGDNGGGNGAGGNPGGEPREVIVDASGNGDFTTIQRALRDAVPGTVILVRGGVYNDNVVVLVSGTADNPITIKNYPDEKPVIVPSLDFAHRVELNAEYIVLDGFEIYGGWDGIKLYKGNNIVRNNYVHHNKFGGIIIAATVREISNVLLENNVVESNGYEPDSNNPYPGISPKNVHGIYISDFSCKGTNDITIKDNVIRDHGGRALLWNGEGCSTTKMRNTLVEVNLMENNSWGFAFFYNVEGAVITNNVIVLNSRPETNDTVWTFFGIWESEGNTISENEFHSTLSDVDAITITDEESENNTVDNNLWRTAGDLWIWEGEGRTDWEDYQQVTGWDPNGDICIGCE